VSAFASPSSSFASRVSTYYFWIYKSIWRVFSFMRTVRRNSSWHLFITESSFFQTTRSWWVTSTRLGESCYEKGQSWTLWSWRASCPVLVTALVSALLWEVESAAFATFATNFFWYWMIIYLTFLTGYMHSNRWLPHSLLIPAFTKLTPKLKALLTPSSALLVPGSGLRWVWRRGVHCGPSLQGAVWDPTSHWRLPRHPHLCACRFCWTIVPTHASSAGKRPVMSDTLLLVSCLCSFYPSTPINSHITYIRIVLVADPFRWDGWVIHCQRPNSATLETNTKHAEVRKSLIEEIRAC
jgi:hypothetical protein